MSCHLGPLYPSFRTSTFGATMCSFSYIPHRFLLGYKRLQRFRSQEIDGQALLLLKEEHLMSAMNIKLGPCPQDLC